MSTFGSDVAGYQSATNPTSTKELFFRWTELGAWSPVMRTHHGTEPKLEWNWQSDADSTAHWVRYAKLHTALAPYMRGLAQTAHDTGISIWRALPMEFPSDAASWPVADEVMVGGGVLVAPVQTVSATSRSVYLPPGTWFPWSGGASVAGGVAVTAAAAVGEIPVYALAGAIDSDLTRTGWRRSRSSLRARPPRRASATTGSCTRSRAVVVRSPSRPTQGGCRTHSAPVLQGSNTTWNGKALAACDAALTAPCAAAARGQVTAYVVGPGKLVAEGATLTVAGGSATRKLTLVVRGPT